jgi:hypothetical protein
MLGSYCSGKSKVNVVHVIGIVIVEYLGLLLLVFVLVSRTDKIVVGNLKSIGTWIRMMTRQIAAEYYCGMHQSNGQICSCANMQIILFYFELKCVG